MQFNHLFSKSANRQDSHKQHRDATSRSDLSLNPSALDLSWPEPYFTRTKYSACQLSITEPSRCQHCFKMLRLQPRLRTTLSNIKNMKWFPQHGSQRHGSS